MINVKKNGKRIIDIWDLDELDPEVMFYNRIPLMFKESDKLEIECPEGWEPIIEDHGKVKCIWGFRKKKQ